jgi:hypothetical protein
LLGQVASLSQGKSDLQTKIERYEHREEEFRRLQCDHEQQAEELESLRASNQKLNVEMAQALEDLKQTRVAHEAALGDIKKLLREIKGSAAQNAKLKAEYEARHKSVTQQLAHANDQMQQLSTQNGQTQSVLVTQANLIKALEQELSRGRKANNELKSLLLRLQEQVNAAHQRTSSGIGMADVSDRVLAHLRQVIADFEASDEGPPPDVPTEYDEPVGEKPGVEVEQIMKVKGDLGRLLTMIGEEFAESSVEDWNADLASGALSDGPEAASEAAEVAPAKQRVEGGSLITSEDILRIVNSEDSDGSVEFGDLVDLKAFADDDSLD